jgi:phospholipase D1/2
MTPPRTTIPPARPQMLEATRVAYLVDGEAYFKALVAAMIRAERSIRILGWDIDARTQLPDPFRVGATISLRRLLNRIARRRRALRIHILGWDFSAVFALERQPLPAVHLDWRTHERVHFAADAVHPPGASHHQKVVVVDDRLAFVGGMDIAIKRWDTSEHVPNDPRRVGPSRELYEPFHDVQMVVAGPVAEALGDLTRARWRRATGEPLARVTSTSTDPWPKYLAPDVEGAIVEISTTDPPMESGVDRGPSAVEESFLDQIAAAKRLIYVENQYFSCPQLAEAIRARLDEDDGPEVLLVAPRFCVGWLEKRTMGVLRRSFLATVRAAKHASTRFRAVAPFANDSEVFVHSKVMVVDDRTARIGSANWSRRSQSVDTECDATVHATSAHTRAGVRLLRDRLLAEHLGCDVAEVESALASHGSLVRLVDEAGVGRRGRHVRPLEDPQPSRDELTWLGDLADPERPLDATQFAVIFARSIGADPQPIVRGWMKVAAATTVSLVVALLVFVAAR